MVAKNLNTAVDKRRNIKANNYPPVNRFNDYVLLVYFTDCLVCLTLKR